MKFVTSLAMSPWKLHLFLKSVTQPSPFLFHLSSGEDFTVLEGKSYSSACFTTNGASASHFQRFYLFFQYIKVVLHHLSYLILGLLSGQLFPQPPSILAVIVFSIFLRSSCLLRLSVAKPSCMFTKAVHIRTQCSHLLQQNIIMLLFCSTPFTCTIGSSDAQPGV